MTGSSQHSFRQEKSGWTSLTAFYNEMIGLEGKGRRVDAGHPASGEVLQADSQHILIDKMLE